VGRAAGLVAWGRGGKSREVRLGEEECVEPVDPTFVSGGVSVRDCGYQLERYSVRLAQVVQSRYALGGHFVNVLEYDVGIGAIGQRYRGRGCQLGVCLSIGLYNLLLGRRVPQWHRDSHTEGCLGLVDGTEWTLLVDLCVAPTLRPHILSAPLLVSREGGDGESRPRCSGGRIVGLLGGVG
jgi:hypothetical protein